MTDTERNEYARAVAQRIEEEFVARLERFMGAAIPAVHPEAETVELQAALDAKRCPFLRDAA